MYVFDLATGISLEYTQQVHNMLDDRVEWYSSPRVGDRRPRANETPFYALKVKKVDGWIRIGTLLIKEVEDELDEDFTQGMFAEDERAWTLEYLEFHWKKLYRNHYGLGWRDPIPGPITLSYEDFVCLSRGSY